MSLICAVAANGVIGVQNRLPWVLPADLKRFKQLTMGHPIIMGRKTFESLGNPLPGRTNIVVTHRPELKICGALTAGSLEQALALAGDAPEAFVIGGAALYTEALPVADRLYVTEVHQPFEGDTVMPAIDRAAWREVSREDHPAGPDAPFAYSFVVLEKQPR